jgi:hypothetical protein
MTCAAGKPPGASDGTAEPAGTEGERGPGDDDFLASGSGGVEMSGDFAGLGALGTPKLPSAGGGCVL